MEVSFAEFCSLVVALTGTRKRINAHEFQRLPAAQNLSETGIAGDFYQMLRSDLDHVDCVMFNWSIASVLFISLLLLFVSLQPKMSPRRLGLHIAYIKIMFDNFCIF